MIRDSFRGDNKGAQDSVAGRHVAMNLFTFAQMGDALLGDAMNRGHDAWHRKAAGAAGYTSRTNTARCVPAALFFLTCKWLYLCGFCLAE